MPKLSVTLEDAGIVVKVVEATQEVAAAIDQSQSSSRPVGAPTLRASSPPAGEALPESLPGKVAGRTPPPLDGEEENK